MRCSGWCGGWRGRRGSPRGSGCRRTACGMRSRRRRGAGAAAAEISPILARGHGADHGTRFGLNIFEAVLLGAIEGVTEFLPISSTGHLTIVEKLLGYSIDDPDITAFTAIIQSGAVLATVIFLRHDIARIVPAWLRGLFNAEARRDPDW